jgi:hypothetical protein
MRFHAFFIAKETNAIGSRIRIASGQESFPIPREDSDSLHNVTDV